MDLYSYLTEVIAIFYSLSVSRAAISGYPNIILIISIHTFFFNKKMVCKSSVSAFMANILNFIMKSTICFFSYLNISIFHSVFAALLLLLNVILISHTNSSQFWVSVFLSSSLSFFWTYILVTHTLR